jgi:tetratricopeptide (TPR) repeat protein
VVSRDGTWGLSAGDLRDHAHCTGLTLEEVDWKVAGMDDAPVTMAGRCMHKIWRCASPHRRKDEIVSMANVSSDDDALGWVRFAPVLIVAVTALAYLNSFRGAFLHDDLYRIVRNTALHGGRWGELLGPRIVVYATLRLNYLMGGLHTAGYHAVNLAIHVANALLLFGISRHAFCHALSDGSRRIVVGSALLHSLLWAIHPIQTESVTYLIQRAESLSAFFLLLALYGLILGTMRCHAASWNAIAVIACALGMATKESFLLAPVILLIYDRCFLSASVAELIRLRLRLHSLFILTWGLLAVLVFIQKQQGLEASAGFGLSGITPASYALTQCQVVPHYMRLVVVPAGLCLDYGWPMADGIASVMPGMLFMAGILAGVVFLCVRRPSVGFWGLWFFVLLAPSSSIFPITDFAVEHRMYLPLAGLLAVPILIGATWLVRSPAEVRWMPAWRTGATVALIALVCVLSGLTVQRNRAYLSEQAMWRDVLAKYPMNPRAHLSAGSSHFQAGRLAEARVHLERAVELDPSISRAHYALAATLLMMGETGRAEELCLSALTLAGHPEDKLNARLNYGLCLAAQGRIQPALEAYATVIRESGSFRAECAQAHYLSGSLLDAEAPLKAEEHYRTAIATNPHAPALNNLGILLAMRGDLEEAEDAFQTACELAPDYVDAQRNLWRARKNRSLQGISGSHRNK